MSDTRVTVLTPPGTGAVGVVEARGPGAWATATRLFRPAGPPLPDESDPPRFRLGRLGDGGDDVILVAKPGAVEVHCHGGRRVVRWVVEQFLAAGGVEVPPGPRPLERAPTLRTASILLDQLDGAFDRAAAGLLALLDSDDPAALPRLERFAALSPVGRHLVAPWKVAVAGAPNVGKSSLVNALAGYQRSVVAPTAGTTRDVVTAAVAFDGWPVELADTAGLRAAPESLEAEGIALARRFLAAADLVLWVADAADPNPAFPAAGEFGSTPILHAANKSDLPSSWPAAAVGYMPVSALTGDGVAPLLRAVVAALVPVEPDPGEAVPFTPALADATATALTALRAGNFAAAATAFRAGVAAPR